MSTAATTATEGLVAVRIGQQTFGAPVLSVQDVIAPVRIDRVPRAPPEVAGSLNLRGRIVTAIDMRRRLGMAPRAPDQAHMSVIVEGAGELYALQVDDVGDVLWLDPAEREPQPITLAAEWRGLCSGLYRLDADLVLVLDIDAVLALDAPVPASALTSPLPA
ncbi:chemotaxis protein CheW [Brevundimonas sp.]|uniref:chemotaxis protein CheW n=1 Tax=Brevundimonas sp. TaxID=1871086 RepID=UPI003BAA1736